MFWGAILLVSFGLYANGLRQEYGRGCPANEAEWLGEINATLLLIAGATLVAVGQTISSGRK